MPLNKDAWEEREGLLVQPRVNDTGNCTANFYYTSHRYRTPLLRCLDNPSFGVRLLASSGLVFIENSTVSYNCPKTPQKELVIRATGTPNAAVYARGLCVPGACTSVHKLPQVTGRKWLSALYLSKQYDWNIRRWRLLQSFLLSHPSIGQV